MKKVVDTSLEVKYDVFVLTPEGISVEADLEGEKLYLRCSQNLNLEVFYAPEQLDEMDAVEKAAQTVHALKHSRVFLPAFRSIDDCRNSYFEYAVNIFCNEMKFNSKKLVFQFHFICV